MRDKTQYLLVNRKNFRRHSAPETQVLFAFNKNDQGLLRRNRCRASVSDFSVLLEYQSESTSSLELDTSDICTPAPTIKSSLKGSYQNLTEIDVNLRDDTDDTTKSNTGSWIIWKNIFLSQAIVGCLGVMEFSNNTIKQNSTYFMANGQNLPHYVFLGVFWTTKLALRNDDRNIIQVIKLSGFRYLCLSILHVEANYLLLLSFHHNTYLGNQVINCVAAFMSLVIAYALLEVQYHKMHVIGFALTFSGNLGVSAMNAFFKNSNYTEALFNDILRVAVGIYLAFNSTAQEIIVKSIDFVEYMGMIGLIGSIICGFQTILLEGNQMPPKSSFYWSQMLIYSLAQFLLTSLTPRILRILGATSLHLSLTLSGIYSHIVAVICYRADFQLWYALINICAILGSSLFTIKRTSFGTQYFFPVKIVISKNG